MFGISFENASGWKADVKCCEGIPSQTTENFCYFQEQMLGESTRNNLFLTVTKGF